MRRCLPYDRKLPGGRWLTILMNRTNPALFAAAFTDWVRETWPSETWPGRLDLVAMDGKTSRHDRAEGRPPLHLVSAFATNAAIAGTICRAGADCLLAVKANQPTLRAEIEALFSDARSNGAGSGMLDVDVSLDKGTAASPSPARSTG